MLLIQESNNNEKFILEQRINELQVERDHLSGKLLIQGQVESDRQNQKKDMVDMLKEEIEELKEGIDRKEYLL